ncbi:alpha/beta hydrolase [Methylobacter tundripaludum]|uniref:alpha/beta hydrolase n=1 Tax=Methylobacter tundripaludum TaxID=173365 RepID=UPI0009DFC545|nr:alpha/beta hydrolase [Methylobacter tundripaludum]
MLWHFDYNRFPFLLKVCAIRAKKHTVICFALLLFELILFIFVSNLFFEKPLKKPVNAPRLDSNYFIASDNAKLPVRTWFPDNHPVKAVIIALHGFNDYSNFFNRPGNYLKDFGIASYAYDQRGFGNAPERGYWSITNVSTRDLTEITQLVRNQHPGVPLYLLGESMGAAEIIVAMTRDNPPSVDGVILSAPAVWAWESIPWYQRTGLWLANQICPWLTLTGASLHLVPSDNIKMLRELSRDPLVLKKSRIDTIYGLADLMNHAFEQANQMAKLTLVLYGERDEIVPERSVYRMLKTLPSNREWHIALYENGYHLLLRDLEAPIYWRDIAAWIDNPLRNLPSGADKRAATFFCGRDIHEIDGLTTLSFLHECVI